MDTYIYCKWGEGVEKNDLHLTKSGQVLCLG